MGQLTPPATAADFKEQFPRDFKYGTGLDTVTDADINRGLAFASSVFNPDLFETAQNLPGGTSEAMIAYLYASAHFVVTALQAAGGLSAVSRYQGPLSQGDGITSNKSVGSVSQGFAWPDSIAQNDMLFAMTRTSYGIQYLQMLTPRLVGNVVVVAGPNQIAENQNNPNL